MNDQAVNAVCPYYDRADNKRFVQCEGLIEGIPARQMFSDSYTRNIYFARYCGSYNYKNCAHARSLSLKYSKKEGL